MKSPNSWQDLKLEHVVYAYRKAKADCFFDRSTLSAHEFVKYEDDLPRNLTNLLTSLREDGAQGLLSVNLGSPKLVAKKLGLSKKEKRGADNHGYFSHPGRAFENLCETHDLIPEFRLIGDFSVEMHVLSALWINLVGHKFDAKLSQSAYGSRLRRFRNKKTEFGDESGDYHLQAIGSFQPYFQPYKLWRENGLKAIRRELEADRSVIAMSLDLTSYYHRIDPGFLSNPHFHAELGLELSDWELRFTNEFASALDLWAATTTSKLAELGVKGKDAAIGGLPIGLSMVRVISNALLYGLDRDIEGGLAPIYYGRYVDDIFLVLGDPGNIETFSDLLEFLSQRTKYFPPRAQPKGSIRLKLPPSYRGATKLELQKTKQKIFFLKGTGALDLLDNIESQIRKVSSERRLMPEPRSLEESASAHVLTASSNAADEADTLRRADGLLVRRLGWAVQLRSVEILARDLSPNDWRTERKQFYRFACDHILRPDRVLDQVDYLPRLFSLAVSLGDWGEAQHLYARTKAAIDRLREKSRGSAMKINGVETARSNSVVWKLLSHGLNAAVAEALLRSIRWSGSFGGIKKLPRVAHQLCAELNLPMDTSTLSELVRSFREADWARVPYKEHLLRDAQRQRPMVGDEELLRGCIDREEDLIEFLKLTGHQTGLGSVSRIGAHCSEGDTFSPSLVPYFFPTRPYSAREVSLYLPSICVFGDGQSIPAKELARFVRALRGVWVTSAASEVNQENIRAPNDLFGGSGAGVPVAVIDSFERSQPIRLGITSLLTKDSTYELAASGRSDISPERYRRIKTLVDHAIRAWPKPKYLLLPELALPERWVQTVAGLLNNSGISLIAGLDYKRVGNTIWSDAVLSLTDARLGFPSSVEIRQSKTLPAPGEEESLLCMHGAHWRNLKVDDPKPVYIHDGMAFGVLVCSELQNISHRKNFQGKVDAVMVLSWNKDLETFSALVESASLDVHANIALVNNRKYGDSRVRTPAKANHARDLCRLRGGENDHLVVVKLDIAGLRAFQSREKRWPKDEDPYKPVPEGFQIHPRRKTLPR